MTKKLNLQGRKYLAALSLALMASTTLAMPAHAFRGPLVSAMMIESTGYGAWGVDLTARDETVRPGDDFFSYVNGRWLASYELPADKVSFGAFMQLRDDSRAQVRQIIDEMKVEKHKKGTVEQKIGDLYASYLDMERRNALGISPIKDSLKEIARVKSRDDLMNLFAMADYDGTYEPLGGGVTIDDKNPDRYIIQVGYGKLGLPDRDFYLEDTPRFIEVREAYKKHIARMLGYVGYGEEEAAGQAEDILALETRMAEVHWPRTELRDADKTYNPYTYEDFKAVFPGYDWDQYFKARGQKTVGDVIVSTPDALPSVINIVDEVPVETWKAYLAFNLIGNAAPYLTREIDDAAFEFGSILSGRKAQEEDWKRGVNLVSGILGEAIGQVYVERHFSAESKASMQQLVANLTKAYELRIKDLDWMTTETKTRALEKLSTFNPKIGYPDKWKDYSGLKIKPDDLYGNLVRARKFNMAEDYDKLHKPTDRDEWFMSPQTVNAYYNPVFNEIVFPAAILQPPFFSATADAAVNYGAIGAVIGHEIGHGFDDQGSKFDSTGRLNNWWTDEDRQRFEERTAELVTQYNRYQPLEGTPINGQLTLGENIGDLGGVSVAYHAYKLSLDGKPAPVIDGLTGDQRFFLAYAQVWKSKIRDEALLNQIKSDPHSPARYRVNGILPNVDAWYKAFNVGPDDDMYIPPENRVQIW